MGCYQPAGPSRWGRSKARVWRGIRNATWTGQVLGDHACLRQHLSDRSAICCECWPGTVPRWQVPCNPSRSAQSREPARDARWPPNRRRNGVATSVAISVVAPVVVPSPRWGCHPERCYESERAHSPGKTSGPGCLTLLKPQNCGLRESWIYSSTASAGATASPSAVGIAHWATNWTATWLGL